MKYLSIITIAFVLFSCQQALEEKKSAYVDQDPLPSWNDGQARQSIIDFVKRATNDSDSGFIAVEDRIAVFDNDGTLWSEQPMYFQLAFALDQIKIMAADNPGWKNKEPFKSVLNDDLPGLLAQGEHALLQIVAVSHSGMTTDEFDQQVRSWMASARHPRFDRPYTEIIYQPMLEVLEYLRANDFRTFIVSGGGIGFMRPVTNKMYGIPAEQVMGSMMKVKYDKENKIINRYPELAFLDDKAGKPVGIYNFIGRKPVAAFGNSDGDLQMLQWTSTNPNSFMMFVHHTDSIREWAYDSLSHIGRLKEGLKEAKENGWTVASMKDDWKVIYPFEIQ